MEPMDIKTFAAMLHGREYLHEIKAEEELWAKELGYVVVFGYSDDLMEFRGAIYDETGCFDGGTAYVTKGGLFESECREDDCSYAKKEREKCATIEAEWCNPDTDASWTYKTDIPHETFNIFEDGELYCVGIVFDVASLDA